MPLMPDLYGDANGTFRIDDWQVFGPGYHKGKLYTLAECWKVVDNFNRLSKDRGDGKTLAGIPVYIRSKVRLGHDTQRQLEKMMGLPNAGIVSEMKKTPFGYSVSLRNIPKKTLVPAGLDEKGNQKFELFDLEAAVKNGHYNDGSVEYIWRVPDPEDPSKLVDGPVLDAVAILGGERPAVPGQDSPTVTREMFSATVELSGKRYEVEVDRICFSEMNMMAPDTTPVDASTDPMTNDTPDGMSRNEMLEALKVQGIDVSDPKIAGMDDDELRGLLKQGQGDQFSNPDAGNPTMPTPANQTPAPTPDMATLFSEFKTFMSDVTKRIGGCEQAIQGMQKDSQTAAVFSADFQTRHDTQKQDEATRRIKAASALGKVSPMLVEAKIKEACEHSDLLKDVFAAGNARAGKTPFRAYLDEIDARPVDEMMAPLVTLTPAGNPGSLSAFQKLALEGDQYGKSALRMASKAA